MQPFEGSFSHSALGTWSGGGHHDYAARGPFCLEPSKQHGERYRQTSQSELQQHWWGITMGTNRESNHRAPMSHAL